MSHAFRHSIRYIKWHNESHYNLKQDDFDQLYKSLDITKKIDGDHYTIRALFDKDSWMKIKKGYTWNIYTFDGHQYIHYWTNYVDDSKNYGQHKNGTGRAAISRVKEMFQERYQTTLKKAFGYSPEEVKLICSPKQFYYTNDRLMNPNRDILSVSMVDFTSHYPSSTLGSLPDYHTAVHHKGTVKPSKEWPFALYIKSGHIAEYNVFDSHDWVNHKLYLRLFVFQDEYKGKKLVHKAQHPLLNPDEDETILMKASKYDLGAIYAELYERRKENEEFKNAMNKSIGYMATSSYKTFRLSHIRAFILGRANAKMLQVADRIGVRNIIQICVDGAAYIGNEQQGVDDKALGTLHQEFTDAVGRFSQLNCYIIKKDGEIIKFKHGAFNACRDGSDINNPTSLDDVKKWYKESKSFEEEDE